LTESQSLTQFPFFQVKQMYPNTVIVV